VKKWILLDKAKKILSFIQFLIHIYILLLSQISKLNILFLFYYYYFIIVILLLLFYYNLLIL